MRPHHPDGTALTTLLARYQSQSPQEAADLARIRSLASTDDPWRRGIPLHVTASAVILDPRTSQVLLRWHARQQAWLLVGGHADPGEADPLRIALREAYEETRLADLVSWPDDSPLHVVVVPVPAARDEPAHEHADLRFVLVTAAPQAACPERESAPLRWLSLADAGRLSAEPNVRESIGRLASRLAGGTRAE